MSKTLDQMILDLATARREGMNDTRQTLITLVGECSPSGNEKVTEEDVQKVIKKFHKNVSEMLVYAKDASHYSALNNEKAIYERYLPKQMTEEEIREILLEEFGQDLFDQKNMGRVMGFLSKNYKGQYDGKLASMIVKDFHK